MFNFCCAEKTGQDELVVMAYTKLQAQMDNHFVLFGMVYKIQANRELETYEVYLRAKAESLCLHCMEYPLLYFANMKFCTGRSGRLNGVGIVITACTDGTTNVEADAVANDVEYQLCETCRKQYCFATNNLDFVSFD